MTVTHTGAAPRAGGWSARLVSQCLRHRRTMVVALSASLCGAVVGALVPMLTKVIIDDAVVRATRPLGPLIALYLTAAAGLYTLTFLRRLYAGRLAVDVQHDLRTELLRSLLSRDGALQDELVPGQAVGRATGDLALLFGLISTAPLALANASMVLASLAMMAVLSPLLAVISLMTLPALWVLGRRSRARLLPATRDAQGRSAALAGVVESSVAGIRVVKAFGQERREVARLTDAAGRLFLGRIQIVRLNARFTPALQAVPALGQVAILAFGGWLAARGQLSLGTFLAFFAYLTQLVGPVRMVTAFVSLAQQAGAGAERVYELLDASPSLTEGSAQLPEGSAPAVVFDRVTFGYAPDRPVLTDFSLSIAPGETVAVVGGPGSGKSTLAMLLLRFYDPTHGAVRVADQDARDLTFRSLRGAIGFVPEETFLFSGSVRETLAHGRPAAGAEEIRAAARTAQADEFIRSLPYGYDTLVGERGFTLSGGQRQRIALARALLTEPRILILDDVTSAVDAKVEGAVHDGLREVMTGRTTLMVARRRSTIALADRVAVLDRGRLIDVGTHDELHERCTHYRELLRDFGPAADDTIESASAVTSAGHRQRTAQIPARSSPQTERVPFHDAPDTAERTVASRAGGDFRLRDLLRGFRLCLAAGMSLVILCALAGLLLPLAVRHGIGGTHHLSVVVCLAALAVVVTQWAAQYGALLVTGRTGERLLYELRVRVFSHLHRLGLDHYEREAAGRTMTRMTTDVDSLGAFLQSGLVSLMVNLLTLAGVLVALLAVDARMLLFVVFALPVLIAVTVVFQRMSVKTYAQIQQQTAVVTAAIQEYVAGTRITQAFGRENENLLRFTQKSDAFRAVRMRGQLLTAVYFPFIQLLAAVATALLLRSGRTMDPATLVACLLYLELFFGPVQELPQLFDGYQQARVSLTNIRELLLTPSSTPEPTRPRPVTRLRGDIRFRDVDYRYGAGPNALTSINLHIPAGQRVAFVGETGAGKSTLVKLAARLYDPTHGAVLVDDIDIRDLDLAGFRQRLGVVPQEPYFFAGTVRDAVAYGRADATDAEVESATRLVGAHEMIAGLDGEYRHRLSEGGLNLSVGQRQLLALARAELVRPDILLLDEATAALDTAGEALANGAIARGGAPRTTLIVAHRLTVAADADRVVVLHHGQVREDGTHEQLLALGGIYSKLWHAFEGLPAPASDSSGSAPPASRS